MSGRLTRPELAQRVARDIPPHSFVNLGIGLPAVGGAMDLALGAKQVYVMMDLQNRSGESKLVAECSYPLTAVCCVSRVYTDAAVFGIGPSEVSVLELFGDTTFAELLDITRLALRNAAA